MRFLGAVLLLVIVAQDTHAQRLQPADALRAFRTAEVRAHLGFLADDALEGRAPGTRGGRVASRYIAAQFDRIGLQAPASGWFQPVPLTGWTLNPATVALEFETAGARIPVRYPDDAVLWTRDGAAAADRSAEVVFAGYGIAAPEWQWDDFEDADLRGKIVLLLAGEPPSPPDEPGLFEGIALTLHGRWSTKLEQVARRGAAGALIIHTPLSATYSWDVVRASWTGEQYFLPRDEGPAAVEGWIRDEAARLVLADAGRDLDALVARAGRRDFRPVPTGLTAHARVQGTRRRLETDNVIGILPGHDPVLRNEAVVLTAHWDHLGTGDPVNGDSIFNGAYDNASGVAILLEIARVFATLQPDRTIVFVATTAEEQGMLGAAHYTANPAFPLARTAAALNIDGANLWGETFDVSAVGAERSTLGRFAETRSRDLGLRLSPERAPDKGTYYRSDQFPFARAGVPALQIDHGLEYQGRPPGWGARTLSRYEAERYHRPADQLGPSTDLGGAMQQARFAFLIAWDVAHAAEMPAWLPGSEFVRR